MSESNHSRSTPVRSSDLFGPLDPALYRIDEDDKPFLFSAISPDEEVIRQRALDVQKKAYEEEVYYCIQMFSFISLKMKKSPIYPEILERGMQGDAIFLDLGCCMGTDVRSLVFDGYPASQIVACDLLQSFIDLGYELYNDKGTCKIKFIADDVFELPPTLSSSPRVTTLDNVSKLDDLAGNATFIYTGALFHLFDEAKQRDLAVRLVRLWAREPNAIIFGWHRGAREASTFTTGRKSYGHSPESWKKMWEEVVEEIEGEGSREKIAITAELREHAPRPGVDLETRGVGLVWNIRRVI